MLAPLLHIPQSVLLHFSISVNIISLFTFQEKVPLLPIVGTRKRIMVMEEATQVLDLEGFYQVKENFQKLFSNSRSIQRLKNKNYNRQFIFCC